MSTVTILEKIQCFLKTNICNSIKLKKPNDKNVDEFELVTPNIFILNYPPKNYLPEEIKSIIPCIVVNFEDGSDESENSEMNLRLIFAIYNPGFHKNNGDVTEAIPDGNGWMDLINFMDKTKAAIEKNQILNGLKLEYPVKYGIYQKDEQTPETDPYFYGWITFKIKIKSYSATEIDKLLT